MTGPAWAIGVFCEIVLLRFAEPARGPLQRPPPPRRRALRRRGAWALLASVRSVPALLFLQPLHAMSFALWWVASIAYVKERAPAHALAAAQGLFSAAAGVGSVVGMLTWGANLPARRRGPPRSPWPRRCLAAAILATLWATLWAARAAGAEARLKTVAPPPEPG